MSIQENIIMTDSINPDEQPDEYGLARQYAGDDNVADVLVTEDPSDGVVVVVYFNRGEMIYSHFFDLAREHNFKVVYADTGLHDDQLKLRLTKQ